MLTIDELTLDPEFTNQLPPLNPEAYDILEASILEKGVVISPIITWHRIIVDGHQRYDIIQKHPDQNIQYDVREMDFPNRDAALAWMYDNQLGQRNLTPYQINYLIGKQYEAEKLSKGGTGANQYKKEQIGHNDQSANDDGPTAQRIAKEHGVGEKTVRRAEDFAKGVDLAEETVPGTRQEILAGIIKPAYKEIANLVEIDDPEDRKRLIEEFHYNKKEKKKYKEPEDLPEYAIDEPVTDITIEQVERIAAGMESSDGQADEDEVIYELNDALDTLIFRWEKCVEMNPEAIKGESYIQRRDELVEKCRHFLNNFKKKRRTKET